MVNYKQSNHKGTTSNVKCSECNSTSILYQRGTLTCRNCGHTIYKAVRRNKYNASKTFGADGMRRDSKFEASVADELYMLKAAREILDYESQYKVELHMYDANGDIAMKKNWKVDFRVHNVDGSYTLLEAKGMEGDDYRWKRDILLNIWLKEHLDHTYEVRKMSYYKH